jgi:dTDP-4-dehydrorhamnose 3,5-epimerase
MTDVDDLAWLLPGSRKDGAQVSSDWVAVPQPLIDGVALRETRAVLTGYGHLLELFRSEWSAAHPHVDQVFASTLQPGAVSAWHAHQHTVDRIAVPAGTLLVVLFDSRPRSPTRGLLNQFRLSPLRPGLLTIPAQVWHGIQNIGTEPAVVINAVDRAYDYGAPDHWRVDPDSPEIPFRFPTRR